MVAKFARFRTSALVASLAALVGCAIGADPGAALGEPVPPASGTAPGPGREAAGELVDVLARIDALSPARDGVVLDAPLGTDPGFGDALTDALEAAGYEIAEDAEASTTLPVGYTVDGGADGETLTYTVGIGAVQARRSWATDGASGADAWLPAGPLYVRGADATALAAARAPETLPPASSAPEPVPTRTSSEAPSDPARAPIRIDSASGLPVYGGVVSGALNAGELPTQSNVMELGGSNFGDLFAGYANVAERILVFPNDSTRLGADNKAIIESLVVDFDAGRDVFSVVGCSLGPTKVENGNESLALGRANRVKEELVLAGVPSERIVDEGCWAGESSASFPSRGVVLTHKRESG